MPTFEWNQLLGPLGGILAFTLMSGMGMGWRFRVAQDKITREYLKNMLEMTEQKLKDSDEICQMRVDQVREDMNAITDRHTLEINSIRAAHKDEVDTLRGILERVMKRLDEISN